MCGVSQTTAKQIRIWLSLFLSLFSLFFSPHLFNARMLVMCFYLLLSCFPLRRSSFLRFSACVFFLTVFGHLSWQLFCYVLLCFCYVFAMCCYALLCFATFVLCFCYVLLCVCYASAMKLEKASGGFWCAKSEPEVKSSEILHPGLEMKANTLRNWP